jgi:Formin Homology 2 Domain
VKKKDGPVSEEPKVDKIQEVARKKGDVVVTSPPPLPPPPPPASPFALQGLMPIKRKIVTKCKLPTLHWTILRPNQIRGTIFNGHNDEQLRKLINFTHFENKFGIVDSKTMQSLRRINTPKYTTLLEPQRLRNVAILRHKLNADADVVARAINNYDITQLSADNVELLMGLAPKENEIATYRNYVLGKLQKQMKAIFSLTGIF